MLTAAVLAALSCLCWPGRHRTDRGVAAVRRGGGSERHHQGTERVEVRLRWAGLRDRARQRRVRQRDAACVADFAEVVAVGLEAGLDLPSAALASARAPTVRRLAPGLVAALEASVLAGRGVAATLEEAMEGDAATDRRAGENRAGEARVTVGPLGEGGAGYARAGGGSVGEARARGVRRGELPADEHRMGEVRAGRGWVGAVPADPGRARKERVGEQTRRHLRLLASAWRLAETTGAAASAVTAAAAASIREHQSAADRMAVVVAGPRASMVLLSALPLAGPAAAALLGMPPTRLYDSTASRLLAALGVFLTTLGWCWASALLRRACRPGRTQGPPC